MSEEEEIIALLDAARERRDRLRSEIQDATKSQKELAKRLGINLDIDL